MCGSQGDQAAHINRGQFIQKELTVKFDLIKGIKKKQLALSLTSITFCTIIGARISRAPLMGDIGFRWLFGCS
jgi:hypothetical protein